MPTECEMCSKYPTAEHIFAWNFSSCLPEDRNLVPRALFSSNVGREKSPGDEVVKTDDFIRSINYEECALNDLCIWLYCYNWRDASSVLLKGIMV